MSQIILSRYDGHLYDALDLKPTDMPIEHIAHNLAHINRYTGAMPEPLSVAWHSVLVSHLVPKHLAYEGLMHDAQEAIVGDLAHGIKALCPDFQRIEHHVRIQLASFFNLRSEEAPQVKDADLRARELERYWFRGTPKITPTPDELAHLSVIYSEDKTLFLERYEKCRKMNCTGT